MLLPKPAIKSFLDKTNSYMVSGNIPDEVTMHRLKQDAQALQKDDPVFGIVAQGILAGLENNIETMNESYERALSLSKNSSLVLENYAICLKNFGFFRQAMEKMLQLHNMDTSNQHFAENLFIYAYSAGRMHLASNLLEKLSFDERKEEIKNHVLQICRFMDKYQIGDNELEELIEIVQNTLHHHNIYLLPPYDLSLQCDEGFEWWHYQITLPKMTESKFIEIEDNLIDAITCSNINPILLEHFIPLLHTITH